MACQQKLAVRRGCDGLSSAPVTKPRVLATAFATLGLASLAWTTQALAAADSDPQKQPNPEDAKSPEDRDFGHGGQFGIRAGALWGYRMVFRYPDSPFCTEPDTTINSVDDQQKFCGHNGPWALNLGISYAVLDSIEPYLWGRFGLQGEAQTNTQKVLILGAGARIYTMSDSALKIFVEPAIGFELEDGAGNDLYDPPGDGWNPPDAVDYNPEYKRDLILHVAAGPHWDFARQFGAFLSAGLTVGTLRYIHASMEIELGVQLRLP